MTYQVELVELQPQEVAVVRGEMAVEGIPEFLGHAFGAVMQVLGSQQVAPAGPPLARFRHTAAGFAVEGGFPTSGPFSPEGDVEVCELPGGLAARTMHVGDYSGVAEAYEAVSAWLDEHGYRPTGDPWESYLDEPSVAQPRTLVVFPCSQE